VLNRPKSLPDGSFATGLFLPHNTFASLESSILWMAFGVAEGKYPNTIQYRCAVGTIVIEIDSFLDVYVLATNLDSVMHNGILNRRIGILVELPFIDPEYNSQILFLNTQSDGVKDRQWPKRETCRIGHGIVMGEPLDSASRIQLFLPGFQHRLRRRNNEGSSLGKTGVPSEVVVSG
jgi:hypothetical protein